MCRVPPFYPLQPTEGLNTQKQWVQLVRDALKFPTFQCILVFHPRQSGGTPQEDLVYNNPLGVGQLRRHLQRAGHLSAGMTTTITGQGLQTGPTGPLLLFHHTPTANFNDIAGIHHLTGITPTTGFHLQAPAKAEQRMW